jgi:hypothetical protein
VTLGWASVRVAIRADRARGVGAGLVLTLLLVGCGATERKKVEHAAKERWQARSATCIHRAGNLYGCVLVGARIPVNLQFTDDFLSARQHRCFRASRRIVDVSRTAAGYPCAFGRTR